MAPKGVQAANTAVATVPAPSTALANVPSFGQAGLSRGQERLTAADLKTPFLRLGSEKTPQVKDKTVPLGHFFSTLNNKDYGPEVIVIPILTGRGRMHFEDFNKGGGILCDSPDALHATAPGGLDDKGQQTSDCAACTLARWTDDGKGGKNPPACNEQGNYLVLVPGEDIPHKMVLQRTSFKTHRKIATLLAATKVDTFLQKIKLKKAENDSTIYIDAEYAGLLTEEEEPIFRKCEEIYNRMQKTFFASPMGGEAQTASDI